MPETITHLVSEEGAVRCQVTGGGQWVQEYLAHKKDLSARNLQRDYTYDLMVVLGGGGGFV